MGPKNQQLLRAARLSLYAHVARPWLHGMKADVHRRQLASGLREMRTQEAGAAALKPFPSASRASAPGTGPVSRLRPSTTWWAGVWEAALVLQPLPSLFPSQNSLSEAEKGFI